MYMKTELLKIIEGGLERNREKVQNYAILIAKKLREDGEVKFADRIEGLLTQKTVHPVFLDEFVAKPVDKDSRLEMVDVYIPPGKTEEVLVLPELTKFKISSYIESLRYRNKFIDMGIAVPESLLLFGPPGCGKTSIAKYISQNTGLPLVTAKLDSLVSSLLGSTAKNLRRIFDYAKERPCILFLDEFDAIAKARDDSQEVGELKRVVNSLLQNIDEFNDNSILIAATNHHKLLDPAVWRRFSNIVEVPKPDKDEIMEMVKLFIKSSKNNIIDDSKKMNAIVEAMQGLSASEIKVICFNSIKRSIISGDESLNFLTVLHQIYLSRGYSEQEIPVVIYFNNYGVAQTEICKYTTLSMRQVRKVISENGGNI